jgi:hypothetical protein
MNTCLPSQEIIHTYSKDHFIIKCKISDLLSAANNKQIINWKYNRPPDTIRCIEIAKSIYTKQQEIDWILYMVYENDVLKIIDGIHRFHSLQIIKKENSKLVDHLTPNIFGDSTQPADWLYEKYIIISIRLNMTEGQIIDLFQSLNKSNPVPDLYIFDTNQQKRKVIEDVVNEWITCFNAHFTSSKNPNIPNMNRDRFIEILDFVYTKYDLNHSTSNSLCEKLYELNGKLKNRHPPNVSDNALEKCIKTGCFIFLLRREQLQKYI